MTHQAEVDFAYEEDQDPLVILAGIEEKYAVKAMITTINGPGGGWPVVLFQGNRWSLQDLLDQRFHMEADEVKNAISRKEP